MKIEVIDEHSNIEPQLGFNADEIQPSSGWLSFIDSAASAIGSVAARTKSVASSAMQKMRQFGNSILGKVVRSSITETIGTSVGGAVVSRATQSLFQQTACRALGPGAIVVSSASALVLMNRANITTETRNWAMVAFTTSSLSLLLLFLCPEISVTAGVLGNGLGYVVGGVMGGYFAKRMNGSAMPLIDVEHPSRSYIVRALPSLIVPAYANAVLPIQNQALSLIRDLTLSSAAYHAIPIAVNVRPLLSAESRFEFLAAPGMMRSFLCLMDDQQLPGLAKCWASGLAENSAVRGFIGAEILTMLQGDGAYNVAGRTFIHYNELFQNDPEIQQALIQFREAFDRNEESDELATVLSSKLLQKFPKLRLMPDQADAALKALSRTTTSTIMRGIRHIEPRFCGFQLTSERDIAYLEKFLPIYLESYFQYALMKIVSFQQPLSAQETQLFYRSLNQVVQQLYIQRLPVVGPVAGLIEEGIDQAVQVALPLPAEEIQQPVQEMSVPWITALMNILYFVANKLYDFLVYIIHGDPAPEPASGSNAAG